MRRKTPIQLIPMSYVPGDPSITIGEPRPVLATRKSVKRAEFYPAYANDLRPEAVFVMWAFEYDDEQRLMCDGVEYEIIRTYIGDDEREIELVCQAVDLIKTGLSRLRDTIEIWANVLQDNSMGAKKQVPELRFTLPAEVKYLSTGESDSDETTTLVEQAEAKIVYVNGIREDMFVMIEGKRWEIVGIDDPFNRHQTLIIRLRREMTGSVEQEKDHQGGQ